MADILRRRSPISQMEEFIVPPELEYRFFPRRLGLDASNAYFNTSARKTYYKSANDLPSTRIHERMHQGQFLQRRQPTSEELRKIFTRGDRFFTQNHPQEQPAYEFSDIEDWTPERQQQYNAYINLLYGKDPSRSVYVEAATPEKYLTNYVRGVPRPITLGPVTLDPLSLLEKLRK